MNLTHLSANLLSLGAIDFGIIVDGAIVMTEAILRRREAKPNEPLTEAEAGEAARQVARPIFFATIIIITTYLPLFAFQRVEAKLFYPMVYAVGFAQLGALAFALLVIPGLAYVAYRKPRRIFHNPVLGWLDVEYRKVLTASLQRPRIAYVLSAVAAILMTVLGLTVWREFLPDLDEGSIWLHAEMPPGISLQKATDMVAELRQALNEFRKCPPW
jgi:cobalt-zinc-cadmium resistance protein CzcA